MGVSEATEPACSYKYLSPRGVLSTLAVGQEAVLLLLFRHSAKRLNAQKERLATSP